MRLSVRIKEELQKLRRNRRNSIRILVVLFLILIGVSFYMFTIRDNSSVLEQMRTQLTFSPLIVPENTKDYSSSSYKIALTENKEQTLSYLVHTTTGTISISEQLQPPEFTEIPDYKQRFLDNVAKQYDTVQTSNGIIYLGRLARQNNKQLGIMLEKGLLIFINPDKELDSTQWRNFGDQLEIQKIKD